MKFLRTHFLQNTSGWLLLQAASTFFHSFIWENLFISKKVFLKNPVYDTQGFFMTASSTWPSESPTEAHLYIWWEANKLKSICNSKLQTSFTSNIIYIFTDLIWKVALFQKSVFERTFNWCYLVIREPLSLSDKPIIFSIHCTKNGVFH